MNGLGPLESTNEWSCRILQQEHKKDIEENEIIKIYKWAINNILVLYNFVST